MEPEDNNSDIIEIHQGIWSDDQNSKQLIFLSFPEGKRTGNSFLVWCRERATGGASFPVTPCSTFLVDSTNNIEFVAPIETAIGAMPLSPGQYRSLGRPTDESLVTRYHASREVLIMHDFWNYNEVIGDEGEAGWFASVKDRFIARGVLEPYEGSAAPESGSEILDAAQSTRHHTRGITEYFICFPEALPKPTSPDAGTANQAETQQKRKYEPRLNSLSAQKQTVQRINMASSAADDKARML
ncbi:unnamed protein product [Clonostachys solani]|uniref:Uncharacterized protein n=1 Tax=Clonostachys solani TaxID=160281 RepID=A0A9N9ZGI1_9HYPO|nr:unnamed protein product [Clonostachys solani]